MKIYDISQEIFTSYVYPGDPVPVKERKLSIKNGDICNLSQVSMCVHNGTHVDAPYHFCEDGKTIESVELSKFMGKCIVFEKEGRITADDIQKLSVYSKIVFKGNVQFTVDMAKEICANKIEMIGIENASIEPLSSLEGQVHKEFLSKEVIILEGLRLDGIEAGEYEICALPIKLGGCDGAPVRAVLYRRD